MVGRLFDFMLFVSFFPEPNPNQLHYQLLTLENLWAVTHWTLFLGGTKLPSFSTKEWHTNLGPALSNDLDFRCISSLRH